MELEKVIDSKKKKNVDNLKINKIPSRWIILKSLEVILPNYTENISKIEWEIKIREELLKTKKIENYSYVFEIKTKSQIQLLERFMRVVYWRKQGIKRYDLEEKSILANEEREYDMYRKYLKKLLKNRIVKKNLKQISDQFIIGKALDIKELYELFGTED